VCVYICVRICVLACACRLVCAYACVYTLSTDRFIFEQHHISAPGFHARAYHKHNACSAELCVRTVHCTRDVHLMHALYTRSDVPVNCAGTKRAVPTNAKAKERERKRLAKEEEVVRAGSVLPLT